MKNEKMKIEFETKDGVCEQFEIDRPKSHDIIILNDKYVFTGYDIYEQKDNVLCAKLVELNKLSVSIEY